MTPARSAPLSISYNIEHFRNFHNAAPDVCIGFEGAPGHQASGNRGGFRVSAWGGTYGGTGFYTAFVGGLWDALLGEGRRWFNFASSDHHWHESIGGGDFYPGEYQKTWSYVIDSDDDGDDDDDDDDRGRRRRGRGGDDD